MGPTAVKVKYEDLPERHPIRLWCERWGFEDVHGREELVVLAKDLVARTIERVVTDEEKT